MINSMKRWYPKLRGMDLVICGGGRVIPSPMIIRGVTAGRRHIFDRNISVHTGIVFECRGQLLIAQMLTNDGLSVDSMEDLVGKRKRFILGFRRASIFDDVGKREAAQDELAYMWRQTLNYDFPGLFEFINPKAKDRPGAYYCSELANHMLFKYGWDGPEIFNIKVSPYDLQTCGGLMNLK